MTALTYHKTRSGKFYLPANSGSDVVAAKMKAGRYFEPEVITLAYSLIKPGTAVLDIGASYGQMTIEFAKIAGKVYSFEADDFTFEILKKNIEVNKARNVTPIFGAVYDTNGSELPYPVPDFKRFGSRGAYGLDLANTGEDVRRVRTLTIDSLNIQEKISFMKVDVQGSDLFAMRGAKQTILKNKMPILFEFEYQLQEEFGTCWGDYESFIASIGYVIDAVVLGINYLIVPE